MNFRPPWVYDCSRAPCGPCFCAISPHPLAGTWAHHLSGGAHLGVRWLESGVGTWGLPGSVGREHVPHCSSFSEACFLADADKEPGSSSSSDAEEDPLPANKCKKVSSSDAGLDSSMSAVALVLSGGSPTPSTPPQVWPCQTHRCSHTCTFLGLASEQTGRLSQSWLWAAACSPHQHRCPP